MKTYAWSSLATLFCSFLLIACSATQSQENDLQSGEWRVISMNGKNVDSDAVATLTFSSNGRLAGEAFCNNYMAGYQLVDQKTDHLADCRYEDGVFTGINDPGNEFPWHFV